MVSVEPSEADWVEVEVAYARPEVQVILPLKVKLGTTVQQAVVQSRIAERFTEIDLATAKLGIFGKLVKADQSLRAGDRVEIYRPLIADPKKVRKERAAAGKKMKRGAGADKAGGVKSPEGTKLS